jgi:RHS repeat-associated protein
MAYDPFGKRRFANGVYDVNGALVFDYSPATNNGADRGFTGHEHLDELGLVHMNGRLYDATLGVFLQADPLIQELDNLQSYNRYMYCVGGPLSCTDPTGYSWLSKTWKKLWNKPAFRVVAAIVVAVVLGPEGSYALIPESAGAYAGVGNAAIAGFASGAVASGNVQGAFQGMFSGMLFYGVGQAVGNAGISAAGNIVDPGAFAEAVALHAVAGCVSAAASDQKCGPGALSAAFSKAMTPVTGPLGRSDPIAGALASAIVGGTAAELGGGKFANGAVTGAFGYIFNRLAHSSTAKAYVEQLRATSPLAADMFDALAADKSTMYYFDAGPLPESSGGGTVRILNQSPSLWDRLMGRHDPLSVTVVVTVDPNATVTFTDADGQSFRPSTLRLLAHELGHAYTWHVTRGNLVAYRLAYDAAIGIENAIARQLDPKAPIRAVSDHGRGP